MIKTADQGIGIVDSVSSYEIKGYLLDCAPRSISLSSGTVTLFPRINGILIIPNETGSLVGMITWIGYNHVQTNSDINLPKGTRMISLSILGHLVYSINGLTFERGAFSLPTVGDQILLPNTEELSAITKNNSDDCITIGSSPLTGNQPVNISVNELFGRHVAVLGNTGSGKSCTVAGLIQWSVEKALQQSGKSPNARFIILDPNGEYHHTFDNLSSNMDIIKYTVKSINPDDTQLRVPAWMWSSSEWSSIFQASEKTQKPVLREALRILKSASMNSDTGGDIQTRIHQRMIYLNSFLKTAIANQQFIGSGKNTFGKELTQRCASLNDILSGLDDDLEWKVSAQELCTEITSILSRYHKSFCKGNEVIDYYENFSSKEIEAVQKMLDEVLGSLGRPDYVISISEDDPIEFSIRDLPVLMEDIASNSVAGQYIDFMTARIKSMLQNSLLSPVIANDPKISLLNWISQFLGDNSTDKGCICIIDLSLLPSEIIHLIVATIARLIFEALQRYRKVYGLELPTLLVMEEAHSFIKKYSATDDNNANKLCTQVFEKIAREGRKYGLGLIISSQRPAELSSTVLSQCNSFILHRIVNDRDQEMVKRMVPDNFGNLLSELPQLPTQKAIILGSVVTVPTIVDINELPKTCRPKSDTPDFWNVWTHKEERNLDWKPVVDQWQNKCKVDDDPN